MNGKEKKIRTYRISDTDYKKAMRKAKRERHKLGTLIEEFVVGYLTNTFHLRWFTPNDKPIKSSFRRDRRL